MGGVEECFGRYVFPEVKVHPLRRMMMLGYLKVFGFRFDQQLATKILKDDLSKAVVW